MTVNTMTKHDVLTEQEMSGFAVSRRIAGQIERFREKMNLERSKMITYDELMKIPESDKPQYHVLVWKGHGDDAATRRDVITTLLLIH